MNQEQIISSEYINRKPSDPMMVLQFRSLNQEGVKRADSIHWGIKKSLKEQMPKDVKKSDKQRIKELQQELQQMNDDDDPMKSDDKNELAKKKKKLSEEDERLYDTYYDLLLGHIPKDQMNFTINKFFNKNQPYPQNYFAEDNYHPGDLVIKFPNPDHPENDKNDWHNSISHREKDLIFKKAITEKKDIKIIQRAFNAVFELLTNYRTEEQLIKIADLEQKIKKLLEMAKRAKTKERRNQLLDEQDPNNPIYQLNKILDRNKERKIIYLSINNKFMKISHMGGYLEKVFHEDEDDDADLYDPKDYK